jgi:hypothetical protein
MTVDINLLLFLAAILFGVILVAVVIIYQFIKPWVKMGFWIWLGKNKNYFIWVKEHASGFTEFLPTKFPEGKILWYGHEFENDSFGVEVEKVYNQNTNLGVPLIFTRSGIYKNLQLGGKVPDYKDQKMVNQGFITYYQTGVMRAFSQLWKSLQQSPWLFWLVVIIALMSVYMAVSTYMQGGTLEEIKGRITVVDGIIQSEFSDKNEISVVQEGDPDAIRGR